MSAVNYAELDQLAGELLPERTVLGVISPMGSAAAPGTVAIGASCQQTTVAPTTGLFGVLGLGLTGTTTNSCVPGPVVAH